MLLERATITCQKIGNERLQLPIFYESPIALRFEIGDISLSTASSVYFRAAYLRAAYIYHQTAPFDTLLWILYHSADTETDVQTLCQQFCEIAHLPMPAEIYTQETIDMDNEPFTRIFLFWDMETTPPNIDKLLQAIIHTDFHGFRELSSAVFFLNTTDHILYHLYDDRGLDVVAETKESILPLYQQFQNWLLDYDRKRMQSIFL